MKKSIQAIEIESLEVDKLGLVATGLRVIHPFFGAGTVVALFVFPNGSNSMGIEFDASGYKVLAPEYAKLRLQSPT